ncbi:FAD-dependent oxidoreductase [Geodermatophilus sp. YIM 151500]|uniref:FAD-dependent oxidoreductase n=1 Tax=Geodermatophilus sp. YIM 151500 TaxID=2984531 RepID=UPI0021E470D6|nr:FAD-dependent monooxygenase [Geodermatophilus sp. YIM 151500]MCV2490785.1 FAD-dependent oxidoreductase [Geodermatophilus sp. YIM 151500]
MAAVLDVPDVRSGRRPGGGLQHAVVVGGSMAGLLAARVLATHADRVTLVERDALPDGAEHRRGVPQGRHAHILLPRGRLLLDRLFPGFSDGLLAAGAVPVSVPGEVLMLGPFGWMDRRAAGWDLLAAGRPVFEAEVRRRVRALPGVIVLDGADVTALRASADRRRVTGVTVRAAGTGAGEELDADLVVDASGRGTHAAAWLADLGIAAPEQTRVDADIAYATRIFAVPDGWTADWKVLMLTSQPPGIPRTGYLFPIEGRRWIVSVMGAAGQHPPTDEAGWHAFVRSLRSPVIADALAGAEPLTDIRGHRGTTNRRWHVDRARDWPERFVVVGDAVCAFNPIYGQGMTTAALAATTLDDCLCEHRRRRGGDLDGFARRFQRRLARRTADPWSLSTGEDLRFPTTTGMQVTPATRMMHGYLDRVSAASTRDPAVGDAYVRVLGMLARPASLFAPRVLAAAARTPAVPDTGSPPPRRSATAPALAGTAA